MDGGGGEGDGSVGGTDPLLPDGCGTYGELVGLSVSAATLEEVTTVAGQRLREVEAREAQSSTELPGKGREEPVAPVEHLCISLDGTMVNTHEGWREVKVVSISEVEEREEPTPEGRLVALVKHSYRAGFWEAKEFGEEQWAEAQRRGVEVAGRLTCVNDGAVWIWALVLMCYPLAVQVVDWWHAVDRLWKVGNMVLGQGNDKTRAWVTERKDDLWAGRVRAVIAALGEPKPQGEEAEKEVRLLREYLQIHADRMRYQEFRELGVPIGSGTVESGCKNVVGSRMKRGGMRWKVERAEGVLALRCALLSDRWQLAWGQQRQAA